MSTDTPRTRVYACNQHTPLIERFFKRVSKTDYCWNWTGSVHSTGYGRLRLCNKLTFAHRAAWILMRGPLKDGETIDHLCHNKLCVNPDHLEPVSRGENARRYMLSRTHCAKGHPFNEENTAINHNGHRRCRECGRAYSRKYEAAKRSAK
jgi:hypothetical protein